jgi:hypothetical protein
LACGLPSKKLLVIEHRIELQIVHTGKRGHQILLDSHDWLPDRLSHRNTVSNTYDHTKDRPYQKL